MPSESYTLYQYFFTIKTTVFYYQIRNSVSFLSDATKTHSTYFDPDKGGCASRMSHILRTQNEQYISFYYILLYISNSK